MNLSRLMPPTSCFRSSPRSSTKRTTTRRKDVSFGRRSLDAPTKRVTKYMNVAPAHSREITHISLCIHMNSLTFYSAFMCIHSHFTAHSCEFTCVCICALICLYCVLVRRVSACSLRKLDDLELSADEWSLLSKLKQVYLVVRLLFTYLYPFSGPEHTCMRVFM